MLSTYAILHVKIFDVRFNYKEYDSGKRETCVHALSIPQTSPFYSHWQNSTGPFLFVQTLPKHISKFSSHGKV